MQNGSTAAHTLLSDERAGGFLVVLSVQTGAAGAGAHTWLILLTKRAPQWAEVVSSPADADLMCVADRHVRRQKVTLVILVVQVPRPHDVTELLWRNLAVAWHEGSLVEHGDACGAVPDGAVVSDSACVFRFLGCVDSPSLKEEHHVSHLSDHCTIGQLQVIFWVPITTTTKASSGHRCIMRSDVLQHQDASAVIPLYADPARCVDQVHAACVFHIKRVTGVWKSSRSVVYCHRAI